MSEPKSSIGEDLFVLVATVVFGAMAGGALFLFSYLNAFSELFAAFDDQRSILQFLAFGAGAGAIFAVIQLVRVSVKRR